MLDMWTPALGVLQLCLTFPARHVACQVSGHFVSSSAWWLVSPGANLAILLLRAVVLGVQDAAGSGAGRGRGRRGSSGCSSTGRGRGRGRKNVGEDINGDEHGDGVMSGQGGANSSKKQDGAASAGAGGYAALKPSRKACGGVTRPAKPVLEDAAAKNCLGELHADLQQGQGTSMPAGRFQHDKYPEQQQPLQQQSAQQHQHQEQSAQQQQQQAADMVLSPLDMNTCSKDVWDDDHEGCQLKVSLLPGHTRGPAAVCGGGNGAALTAKQQQQPLASASTTTGAAQPPAAVVWAAGQAPSAAAGTSGSGASHDYSSRWPVTADENDALADVDEVQQHQEPVMDWQQHQQQQQPQQAQEQQQVTAATSEAGRHSACELQGAGRQAQAAWPARNGVYDHDLQQPETKGQSSVQQQQQPQNTNLASAQAAIGPVKKLLSKKAAAGASSAPAAAPVTDTACNLDHHCFSGATSVHNDALQLQHGTKNDAFSVTDTHMAAPAEGPTASAVSNVHPVFFYVDAHGNFQVSPAAHEILAPPGTPCAGNDLQRLLQPLPADELQAAVVACGHPLAGLALLEMQRLEGMVRSVMCMPWCA